MSMENESLERKQNGMTVTLLFPKKSSKEDALEHDVRMILSLILQEHLAKGEI